MNLYSEVERRSQVPRLPRRASIKLGAQVNDISSTRLRTRDILLHHPFDSYETVEDFVESGAPTPPSSR